LFVLQFEATEIYNKVSDTHRRNNVLSLNRITLYVILSV